VSPLLSWLFWGAALNMGINSYSTSEYNYVKPTAETPGVTHLFALFIIDVAAVLIYLLIY
jgi:hypothetical protein